MISNSGNLRELVVFLSDKSKEEMISLLQKEAELAEKSKMYSYSKHISPVLYLLIHNITENNSMPPHENDMYWRQFIPIFKKLLADGEKLPPRITGIISRKK